MKLFKSNTELTSFLNEQRQSNVAIGLVPTMGALHEGHSSLINEAKSNSTQCGFR